MLPQVLCHSVTRQQVYCSHYLLRKGLHTTQRLASREKLIILGTGWGSYSVLKNIDKKRFDVVVVSPRNHFLFTPLLASTTVGTLEFRSIIEPVRNTKFREESHYQLAKAVSLDPTKRIIYCKHLLEEGSDTYPLSYDKLVIGVGAQPNTFNVPGVTEHAFFLKEVHDARKIRNCLLANFEKAVSPNITLAERKRLHKVVIVGGGPTGVEFGAELYDFIRQDMRRLYSASTDDMEVTLIEANNILAAFDQRLRNYAEKKIQKRKGFTLIKDAVTEVTGTGVELKNSGSKPCGLVVWSAGIAPQSFTSQLPFGKNQLGQVITDDHLKVLGSDGIFAIGDCADIQDSRLPATAQVAERQGIYLANQLNGKPDAPFRFQSAGMLAYIGGFKGVADTPHVKNRGFSSWILWRSAYLTKLGSWRLRMQVPLDWCKTFFFGRDTSRID